MWNPLAHKADHLLSCKPEAEGITVGDVIEAAASFAPLFAGYRSTLWIYYQYRLLVYQCCGSYATKMLEEPGVTGMGMLEKQDKCVRPGCSCRQYSETED